MKENRLKLGIIFNFNPSWMGGIIYILNLIRTLDFLNESDKPEVFLFYRSDLKKFTEDIEYPYLHLIEWKYPKVYSGYIKSWLTRKNIFVDKILKTYDLDGLYPLHDYPVKTRSKTRLVSWYADLQHEYYPEFFSRRKIIERTKRIKFIIRNSDHLVVSSNAVWDDFKRFFKLRSGLKIHVYHFVSVIGNIDHLDIKEISMKYNLPEEYYMVSNQFHKHKNHRVLLNAMIRLKKKGINIHLAMTGRFPDASHSPYMKELHSLIEENKLQSNISLLGIIPRDEQLFLMKYAQAVLQPSYFEGWSTVIEDARSLQAPVIAASLPVNIEQLGSDKIYFDPDDDEKLAEILSDYPKRNLDDIFYDEYNSRIKKAAQTFLDIFGK